MLRTTICAIALFFTTPALADLIDVSFGGTAASGSPSVYTLSNSFTLPTGFTNASLTIGSMYADDRGVLVLNGTIISNAGIFGPGAGSMTLFPEGPNDPFTFTFGTGVQNLVITTGFLEGLNTLNLIVNDTNNGIFGAPLASGVNISGANVVASVSFDAVPGAPTIGTATLGSGQATIAFTPPASDGGSPITSYTVTSNPGGITATGAASPITVTGLTNGTAYTFTVTATNAVGTGPASATTQAAGTALNLVPSWNLLGNSSSSPISVATTFGDATEITTVWKWNKVASKWAFYAPSMAPAALTTYAQGNGYDVLSSIESKEGFWVNASTAVSLTGPVASGLTLVEGDLQQGWNLVGSADDKTPSQLNQGLSSSLNAAGKTMVTAWAWDAQSAKWKFYAPSLEAQGGTALADYITGKGYLPFSTALSASDGVWLNVAAVSDTTAPTVILMIPANAATGVAINQTANATFSESMDPATINTVSFTVTGPGVTPVIGTVTYNVPGHIATFTPASVLAANTVYTATIITGVKDLAGNALASVFTWTFTTGAAPSITVQPAGQTITAGQNASISVTAAGTSLSYQWQRSTDGGDSFTDLAGATNATLNLVAVPLADNGHQFRVVVSNGTGGITSNVALLTVNPVPIVPAFTTQPANVTITEGQNAQFVVAVSGTPSPTLQWQLSTDNGSIWSNINGATNTVLDLIGAALANNGRQFRAVATNGSGSVTSNAAVLTVTAAPPVSGTTLVSVTPAGAAANNSSEMPSLSADGNWVAFTSLGTDLVAGAANAPTESGHAYVRNLATGVTSLINQTPGGTQSNRGVVNLKLAAGGRYAVFTSLAGDLVADDTNGSLDVFLRDLQTGTTTRLNVLPNGAQITGAGGSTGNLRLNISADGRWVTFISGFDLLGDGSPLNNLRLFLRDTQNNVTLVIASDSAAQTMGQPAISNDGRYVVYGVTDFANGEHRLMRYSIQSAVTDSLFTAVNTATSFFGQGLSLSDDGRYVTFGLRSSTLFNSAASTFTQVVVLDSAVPDTDPGRLTIASTGAGGVGDGRSDFPVLSGDGRYVLFATFSPSLTGDPAATIRSYVMVRDRVAGTTQVASRRVNGSNVWVVNAGHAFSSDGTVLAFVAEVVNMGLPFTLGDGQVFAAPRP